MSLYAISTKELQEVKEKPFKLESEIQELVETNILKLMGLKFVKSEFAHGNLRIDTLAYDEAVSAFVICNTHGNQFDVMKLYKKHHRVWPIVLDVVGDKLE